MQKAVVRGGTPPPQKTNLSEHIAVVSVIMVYLIKLAISMRVVIILCHSHIVTSTGASLLFPLRIKEL